VSGYDEEVMMGERNAIETVGELMEHLIHLPQDTPIHVMRNNPDWMDGDPDNQAYLSLERVTAVVMTADDVQIVTDGVDLLE
jgi:hypothetical protein